MLFASWQRWVSPLIDSGREMDLPLRLLQGEMLYRDVHYLYPPLSPYFNAQIYRLFGVHLNVSHANGLVCAALIVLICYRIARRILSPAEAALATIAIIVWCIFKPAGNLISPYAFAALHGMILVLATLIFTLRYSENRRRGTLIATGVLIGLAAITKQEFALAGVATVIAAVIYLHRNSVRQIALNVLCAAIPAMVIAAPVYAYLFHRVGWHTLIEDCHLFYTHLPPPLVFYNAQRTGLDHPLSSLAQMLGAIAVSLAVASAIVWLSVFGIRRKSERELCQIFRWAGFVFVAASLCVFSIKTATHGRWDGSPLRALPFLLVVLAVIKWRRGQVDAQKTCSIFIISIYSLAILARVALRVPSGGAFGGFFLPTSLILVVYLLIHALPNAIKKWSESQLAATYAKRSGQVILVTLIVVTSVVFAIRFRRNFTFEVSTSRGSFYTTPAVGEAMKQAIDFIESHTSRDDAIVVVPEGSDLTFLSDRRMPLRHTIMTPGLMSARDELRAIDQLKQLPVRYVLLVNRPTREFGAETFGRDYYQALGKWIDEHYRLVKVCGINEDPTLEIGSPTFFIKIFKYEDLKI